MVKSCSIKNKFGKYESVEKPIVRLGLGEILGEMPLIGQKQSYSVVVESESCKVLQILNRNVK